MSTPFIISKKKDMIRLCETKFSDYANNYDDCSKYNIEGCEGCGWYVHPRILEMFELQRKKMVDVPEKKEG